MFFFLLQVYIDELTNSGDTVMATHSVACRLLAIAEKTAVNMVFVAMLVEGIYLHRMIVAIFRNKMNVKWLYGIGVGMCDIVSLKIKTRKKNFANNFPS